MADIKVEIEDAQPINVSLGEAVNIYEGWTGDYNDPNNLPDLTLKADKSDTYTKIEVDTSLAGKAELVHVHAISDVTGLQSALDSKSATNHTHTAANVTDFDTEVSNNTDVAANTAARHTHANSAVLDATTASFTTADETKLDGIAAGAQVNTVTSVNTRTGAVTGLAEASDLTAHTGNTSNPHSVTKAQVGLGNVDNTSDVNKPVSTATQTALDGKASTSHTHAELHTHANKTALDAMSGTNTGDQDLSGLMPKTQTLNAQTAAYTLVAADATKLVTVTVSAAANVTVPENVFSAGQTVEVLDAGTARITFVAGSGMTLNATPSLVSRAQYSGHMIKFLSATSAVVIGDLA